MTRRSRSIKTSCGRSLSASAAHASNTAFICSTASRMNASGSSVICARGQRNPRRHPPFSDGGVHLGCSSHHNRVFGKYPPGGPIKGVREGVAGRTRSKRAGSAPRIPDCSGGSEIKTSGGFVCVARIAFFDHPLPCARHTHKPAANLAPPVPAETNNKFTIAGSP